MTGQDIDRLVELLAIFRPGGKRLKDQSLKNGWLFVLKPYRPEDVREAMAEYLRRSKYWPDVTDIAKLCPPIETENRNGSPKKIDWYWQKHLEMHERYDDLKRRRREVGLPENHWEAKEAGMSFEEYDQSIEAVGLGFEGVL